MSVLQILPCQEKYSLFPKRDLLTWLFQFIVVQRFKKQEHKGNAPHEDEENDRGKNAECD